MFKRLKLKFVLITMGLMFVIILIVFTSVYLSMANSMEQGSYGTLERVVMDVGGPRPGKLPRQVNMPTLVVKMEKTTSGYGNMEISGHNSDLLDESQLQSLVQEVLDSGKDRGYAGEYRYLLRQSNSEVAVGFADMTYERSTKRNLIIASFFIGIGAMGAIFLISMYLASRAIAPVEEAFNSQKRFVADASHELKTPLTVILASAKLLRQGDTENRDQWIDNIDSEALRMKKLTDEMLYLAKVENIGALSVHAKLNLSECVRSQVLMSEALFYEGGRELDSDIQDNITVHGDEEQMCRLIMILLDNARKYAQGEGKVLVHLREDGRSRVKLWVENPGQLSREIVPEDLFNRFCRADVARTDGDSYGLGLSIASTIVAAHKGKIWVDSKNEQTSFYISLPRA